MYKCLISFIFLLRFVQTQYSPTYVPGEDGRVQWARNCDFNGETLGSVRSIDTECGELCFRKPECTRFTWTYENGGTCRFKAGDGKAFLDVNVAVCGYVSQPNWLPGYGGKVQLANSCDFVGDHIGRVRSTEEECGRLCYEHSLCTRFTWTCGTDTACSHGICRFKVGDGKAFFAVNVRVCGYVSAEKTGLHNGTKKTSERACDYYRANYRSNSKYMYSEDLRMIHGRPSRQDEFPWMAALGYLINENYFEFRCGATIISRRHLLTAAHCCEPWTPIIAQLGTHILNGTARVNMLVESCVKHEQYSNVTYKNDIALIKLEQRITFGDSIFPACLDISDMSRNQQLVATGWGLTEEGKPSIALKKASLRTVDLSVCNTRYQEHWQRNRHSRYIISESQLCAADPDLMQDTCQGDSGGPLQILPDDHSLATVVGITSFGVNCSSPLPGIYTRVASFLDWIESKSIWTEKI